MNIFKNFARNSLIYSLLLVCSPLVAEERLAPPLSKIAKMSDGDGGAEVLYASKRSVLNKDFSTNKTFYYAIKINDEKAANDYGRISIPFNEYYSDLDLSFVNVLTSEDEVKTLSEDAVQKKTGGDQDFYEEKVRMTFAPPQIEVGSILEFQYTITSKKNTIPRFYSDTSSNYWFQQSISGRSARIDKVHKAIFQVVVQDSVEIETQVLGDIRPSFKKKKHEDGTVLEWKWKNIPAIPVENAMPWWEELLPRVRLSTTKDWSQLDSWNWSLVKDKISPTNTIDKIALDLVSTNARVEEKVKAVYGYIQNNVRYVYAHLGRGGYEPHYPDEVLHNAYGDCKDQATLAISLLSALGVEAYPALVVTPRADKPSTELVGLYFDHMMVWVPVLSQSGLWLDTTSNNQMFPGVSSWMNNQPAFILNGKGGELTKVAESDKPNRAVIDFSYQVNAENELILDIVMKFSGRIEQSIRSWLLYSDNREQDLNSLIRSAFDNLAPDNVKNVAVLNLDSGSMAVEITARVEFGGIQSSSEEPYHIGGGTNQLFSMFGDFSALMIPKERKQDWVKLQGELLEMKLSVDPGDSKELAIMQSATDLVNDYFSIRQMATREDGSITVQIKYEMDPLRLDSTAYKKFYEQVSSIKSMPNWQIGVFGEDATATIGDINETTPGLGGQQHLAEAKRLLEEGRFAEAEKAANIAVEINELDGEAWYVLGIAQGFNTNVSSSKRSFKKSRELGFKPN